MNLTALAQATKSPDSFCPELAPKPNSKPPMPMSAGRLEL